MGFRLGGGRWIGAQCAALSLLLAAEIMVASLAALASDQRFALVCRPLGGPDGVGPIIFEVDILANSVRAPGYHHPSAKPPASTISETEIIYEEWYPTGWSKTRINRYTGGAMMYSASKPYAESSEGVPVRLQCAKTEGKKF